MILDPKDSSRFLNLIGLKEVDAVSAIAGGQFNHHIAMRDDEEYPAVPPFDSRRCCLWVKNGIVIAIKVG
jgi:hypothetical protein